MHIQNYPSNVSFYMDTFEFDENISRYRFEYSKNKNIWILSDYEYFFAQLWYKKSRIQAIRG